MLIHGTRSNTSQADAADARGLYLAVMDGWNRGSADAFAAPFADEADFIASTERDSTGATISSDSTSRCSGRICGERA